MIRHIVLFGFNDDIQNQTIDQVIDDFINLANNVNEVSTIEYGTDVSVEGLHQGHTHAFLLSFETIVDRDAYLAHPLHLSFVDKIDPLVKSTTVLDYRPNKAK